MKSFSTHIIGKVKAVSERMKSILLKVNDKEEWYKTSDGVLTYLVNHRPEIKDKNLILEIDESGKVVFIKFRENENKEASMQELLLLLSCEHDAVEIVKGIVRKTDIKEIDKVIELVIYTRDKLYTNIKKINN